MTVLSLTALSRLAERHVREAGGGPVPIEQLVTLLDCIDEARARAGIRLAVIAGRLECATDDEQQPCIRVPDNRERAA
jgi:hypothetical protein